VVSNPFHQGALRIEPTQALTRRAKRVALRAMVYGRASHGRYLCGTNFTTFGATSFETAALDQRRRNTLGNVFPISVDACEALKQHSRRN
jgi:hypothetical protein